MGVSASHTHSKRVTSRLVIMGSAAVLAVYGAGYLRTSAAANRLATSEMQRIVAPAPARVAEPLAPAPIVTKSALEPAAAPVKSVETLPRPPSQATEVRHDPPAATAPVTPTSQPVPVAPPTTDVVLPVAPVTSTPVVAAVPPVAVPVAPTPAPPPPSPYKDGSFFGWGTSRHGDIQATVVIEGGKILSATITGCYTRYPCSRIAVLPPQVVERQSAEVDYVSRATDSTYAFYYAVLEALAKAK
jgi:uncharacterized protein with FMN-binding domain